jgi:type 1 glutamine amidotransferase
MAAFSSMRKLFSLLPALLLLTATVVSAQNPHLVVYEGNKGPGAGKHIVLISGDHEYRSEESLPALARILAQRYGFKCSVFFTVDPDSGFIDPGNSKISGLEALKTADLMVVFLRFQDFADDQMQHIADYLDRGGPVVGFRTATHAFQIKRPDAKFARFDWQNKGDFAGGFGRQILGETWVSHYGTNHKMSSRLILEPSQASHPVLRGVKDVWVQSGGYTADPLPPSVILARGQILNGMTPDSPPAPDKQQVPVAWVRSYTAVSGKTGRVFTTTHGASEDLLNEGFRRMAVNGVLWALGLENAIAADGNVGLVGPYQPTTFNFKGYVKGVKPAEMAGWDTPIPPKK